VTGTEAIIAAMEREWPRWQIWNVTKVVGPDAWCAQPWDMAEPANVINAGSPQWLAEAIAAADRALPAADWEPYREAGLIQRRFRWPWTITWDPARREFTATHAGMREPMHHPDGPTLAAELAAWRAQVTEGRP
jgi:hypothetical protein